MNNSNNKRKILNRISLWVSVIIVGTIFYFTFQNGDQSYNVSKSVQNVVIEFTHSGHDKIWSPWENLRQFRQYAHIFEYFILSISLTTFSVTSNKSIKSPYVFLTCIGVSILDQSIKGYLPYKEFDILDLGYDGLGYIIGIVITYFIWIIVQKKLR